MRGLNAQPRSLVEEVRRLRSMVAQLQVRSGADLTIVQSDLNDVDFLTLGLTTSLDNERLFTPGDGLAGTDNGAGNTYDLDLDLASPSGLEISGGKLRINVGDGLSISGGDLDLQTPGTLSASSINNASGNHTHAITASADPGAAESILKSTPSGGLTLEQLTADNVRLDGNTVSTISGGLALAPSDGDVLLGSADRIGTDNFVSQLTGWRIDYGGSADFRSIFADELHVRAFIADIEQALAGGQIVSKSVALLSRDFEIPLNAAIVTISGTNDYVSVAGDKTDRVSTNQAFVVSGTASNDGTYSVASTIYIDPNTRIFVNESFAVNEGAVGEVRFRRTFFVEDLPGFPDTAGFASGDWVRMRFIDRSGGGLVVDDVWGTVSGYSDLSGGEQSWVLTCRDDGQKDGSTVYAGAVVLDYGASGDGYWEVTALGNDVPYSQIVTWTSDPSSSGNHTLRSRLGNLDGVTDSDFPTLGGWGLYSDNAFLAGTLKVLDDSFFAGIMTIDTDGEIRQGSGTLGTDFTGLRMWNDTGIGRIGGYNSDTLQWYGATDGKFYAGGGDVVLDASGIHIEIPTSTPVSGSIPQAVNFETGGAHHSRLASYIDLGGTPQSIIEINHDETGEFGIDWNGTGGWGKFFIRNMDNAWIEVPAFFSTGIAVGRVTDPGSDGVAAGVIEGTERTADPATPAADAGRLYFYDNAGVQELRVRFGNGTIKTIVDDT